jgi:hypothetical protein
MGLTIPGTNDSTYYGSSGDHGAYQFLTLSDIVKTFTATYCGVGKVCENIRSNDVYFHATRAMQEFSFDVFRSIKAQEIKVGNTLQMMLPRDFVNHVKLSWSDSSGIEHVVYPAIKTSNPTDVGQDETTDDNDYTFTGNVLNTDESSTTWENFESTTPNENQQDDYNDNNYKYMSDERYGINPVHAQINGSYYIDYQVGKIHFSSNLSGKILILKYISDGMAVTVDNNTTSYGDSALVHKFAEEAMYKHILYGCLSALKEPPPTLPEIKKERWAETRKAKLRLSNIKIEELTQILRGGSKWIKH